MDYTCMQWSKQLSNIIHLFVVEVPVCVVLKEERECDNNHSGCPALEIMYGHRHENLDKECSQPWRSQQFSEYFWSEEIETPIRPTALQKAYK